MEHDWISDLHKMRTFCDGCKSRRNLAPPNATKQTQHCSTEDLFSGNHSTRLQENALATSKAIAEHMLWEIQFAIG